MRRRDLYLEARLSGAKWAVHLLPLALAPDSTQDSFVSLVEEVVAAQCFQGSCSDADWSRVGGRVTEAAKEEAGRTARDIWDGLQKKVGFFSSKG